MDLLGSVNYEVRGRAFSTMTFWIELVMPVAFQFELPKVQVPDTVDAPLIR